MDREYDGEFYELTQAVHLERVAKLKEVKDIMEEFELNGYQPELVTDDSDFKPIKGKYSCRIADIGKREGTSQAGNDYSFWYIKLQVTEVIDGDKGTNRYLDRNYGDKADKSALKQLADDLFTAGLEFNGATEDEFFNSLQGLRDKTVNVRAWSAPKVERSEEGKWVPVEPEQFVQRLKIVKEFKAKAKKTSDTPF